jgi:glycerol dehydrogenase-like iron-containing ADH family enzyme
MTAGGEVPDVGALRRELAGAPGGSRLRPLGLGRVVAGPGALDALPGLVASLRRPGPVVVLAAATPMTRAGRDLRAVVGDALPQARWSVIGPGDGLVHADEPTLAAAAAAADGAGCVITVGSGTVTDIGKSIERSGTSLITVQTATSVNGYADPFSVLLRRGVKRTTASRWPDALVIDPGVLAGAPPELNRAGAGDMMALFTALADWYLAAAVAGEIPAGGGSPDPDDRPGGGSPDPDDRPGGGSPDTDDRRGDPPYHPAVAGLVRPCGPGLLALAARLGSSPGRGTADQGTPHQRTPGPGTPHQRTPDQLISGPGTADPSALTELARLLTLSGIAMGVAGTTAPSSGMEHGVSHLLEMAATAGGRPGSFHGTQVGVASVVAARTWARVLRAIDGGALDRPAALPDPDAVRDRIGRAFAAIDPGGAMAQECFSDYARKLRRLGSGAGPGGPLAALRASWPRHRAALDDLLIDPAVLAGALRSAGLPDRFRDLPEPVDDPGARWAVANCALQRRRFGVADLAMLIGAWDEDDVAAVLEG